jgi:hypothetical protein
VGRWEEGERPKLKRRKARENKVTDPPFSGGQTNSKVKAPDLIIYYENSSFFLDIIGRSEAFSENRFLVSGVRFQAGSHFFTTDT